MKNIFKAYILFFSYLITMLNQIKSMNLDDIESDKFLTIISNLSNADKSILIVTLVNSDEIDTNKLSQIINIIKSNHETFTNENEIKRIAKNLNSYENNRFLNMLIHFRAIKKSAFLKKLKNINQNARLAIGEQHIDTSKVLVTDTETTKVIHNINVNSFDIRRAQKVKVATKKFKKEPCNNFKQSSQTKATLNESEEEYNLTDIFGNPEIIPNEAVLNSEDAQEICMLPTRLETPNITTIQISEYAKSQKQKKHSQSNALRALPGYMILNKSNTKRIYLAVLISVIGCILIYKYFYKNQNNQNNTS